MTLKEGPRTTSMPKIKTCKGRFLIGHLLAPDQVDVEEMAHSMSLQCRYNGHIYTHYSVAQHSVVVSYLCAREDEKKALTHDCPETYVGDLIEPVKWWLRQRGETGYDELEWKTLKTIWDSQGIPYDPDVPELPPSVQWADLAALVIEIRSFYGDEDPVEEWDLPKVRGGRLLPRSGESAVSPWGFVLEHVEPLPAMKAKQLFLDRWEEVFG